MPSLLAAATKEKRGEGAALSIEITGQGSLFSSDFLTDTIRLTAEWQTLSPSDFASAEIKFRSAFDKFPTGQSPTKVRPKTI